MRFVQSSSASWRTAGFLIFEPRSLRSLIGSRPSPRNQNELISFLARRNRWFIEQLYMWYCWFRNHHFNAARNEKASGAKNFVLRQGCWSVILAPGAGLEPATLWLTVRCSTIELPRIMWILLFLALPPPAGGELPRNKPLDELSTAKTFQLLFAFECFKASGNFFFVN